MSKTEIVSEIHKPARKNFPRRRVIVKGLHDLWQADLIEMIPYAKINKDFRYILVVINAFSKLVWTEPVKRKTSRNVAEAFKKFSIKQHRLNCCRPITAVNFAGASFETWLKNMELNGTARTRT